MKKTLILSALVVGAVAVRADQSMSAAPATGSETAVFQASLTPNIAIHPRTTEIHGLALHIWGENPLHGAALGFVNGSTGESKGFTWGMYNYDDSYVGVQWGIVNYSKQNFKGWQGGMVNISKGKFTGWQDAWVNWSEEVHGLQSGIFNYSTQLHGVQLGLINVAANNDWFKDMPHKFAKGFPFFNWSF
jgi:hypothetical protein